MSSACRKRNAAMINFPNWYCLPRDTAAFFTGRNLIMAWRFCPDNSCTTAKQRCAPPAKNPQARVIAATIRDVRVFCIYAPNGQAVGSAAFQYKLRWFVELRDCIANAQKIFRDVVVCGDFNVAPEDRDVHDPVLWRGAIMCSENERAAFRALEQVGFRDTLRIHHADTRLFSWWDYRMMAFQKNRGLRIDEILASDSLAKRCTAAGIDREMRNGKDPSDHAPVWAEFS